MEFCTRRELQNQTGHGVEQWPLVVLKELIDNALDACEEAEVAPMISVAVEPGSIVVEDNADGIKTSTIKSILDYTIRVSSREAYVSPTRGAQGNLGRSWRWLRARSRTPGRQCRGSGRDDYRDPRHRTPDRIRSTTSTTNRELLTTSPSRVKIDRGSRSTTGDTICQRLLLDFREKFIKLAKATSGSTRADFRGSWYGKEFINLRRPTPIGKWVRATDEPALVRRTRLRRYLPRT
jgi:hypothetical protein